MGIKRVGIQAAAVVAVVGLLFVGLPVGYFLVVYGCGREEQRFGEKLADDPVLGAGVDGAAAEDSYQECDDDDLTVVAGKAYRYGGDKEIVLRHYRDAAQAHGWRYRASDCFTKQIDGALASLMLDGPTDGSFAVEVVATPDHSEPWC